MTAELGLVLVVGGLFFWAIVRGGSRRATPRSPVVLYESPKQEDDHVN